jgi:membrane-bound lytic murein transglycosylase A
MTMMKRTFVLFLALAGIRAGAARGGELVQVAAPELGASCDDLDPTALAAAIDQEIASLEAHGKPLRIGDRAIPAREYVARTLRPLAALARQGTATLCAELPRRFAFYRNRDAGPGKFTAYHNPIFRGSRSRHGEYLHALYRRPAGALAALPTAEVLRGALDGQGLELVWLADATEALAAHVEGSASILLDDGQVLSVSSDGHNGQPYQNVSKLLDADGRIPKGQATPLGMTRARKYFIDHPDALAPYWSRNPHFVFFKESTTRGGGRFGQLTPGRSVAVDAREIPLGAALFLRTDKPAIAGGRVAAWISFGRVALAQDTGAGITGPGRVDVFFGTGEYAQQASAVTTRPGEIYVLLAK